MPALRCLTLVLLLAAPGLHADETWKPDGWEHLDVEASVFGQPDSPSTDVQLARLLLPDTHRAVLPPQQAHVSAVYIVREATVRARCESGCG